MDTSYIMKRTQIYLDEEQDRRLAVRARAQGTTKSTLIREAVDEYLTGDAGAEARLQAFRAAVHAAAGTTPRLPSGRKYVDDLRRADAERQRELEERWRG
jgi:hypothetical protein